MSSSQAIIPVIIFVLTIHAPLLLGSKVNVFGHVTGFVAGVAIMLLVKSAISTKLPLDGNYDNKQNNDNNPNNEIR